MRNLFPLSLALSMAACGPCTPPAPGDDAGAVTPDAGPASGFDAGPPPGGFDAGPPPDFKVSQKGRLVWKRYRVVEQDLMAALSLQKDEICNELGLFSCVDFVHLVPLGGNDPFAKGQYEQAKAPQVTTSIALERVVLSACGARVDKDSGTTPVVFSDIDFNATGVSEAAATSTIEMLYKKLLSREATAAERTVLQDLRTDDDGAQVSPRDFAKLACFTIATTSEFLFH